MRAKNATISGYIFLGHSARLEIQIASIMNPFVNLFIFSTLSKTRLYILSYKSGHKTSAADIPALLQNVASLFSWPHLKIDFAIYFSDKMSRMTLWRSQIRTTAPNERYSAPVTSQYFDSHEFLGHRISVWHWLASKISCEGFTKKNTGQISRARKMM